jgi:hypothetical protein
VTGLAWRSVNSRVVIESPANCVSDAYFMRVTKRRMTFSPCRVTTPLPRAWCDA